MMRANQRKTVLVVDDERQVLAAIEDTLEDEFRVVTQTSAEAAIRIIENEPELAVILSDQRMPGMTGDEFLARASEISDASRLIITGFADLEAVVRAVNKGHIFGYISKPWDPAALKVAVYKAAEHNRLLRELSEEKRLFENLMDNIPDAIFFKDREHRFLRLNRPHAARLGVERPQDAVGRQARDFFPPEEARERDAEDEEIIRSGAALADKLRRITSAAGGLRWTSTTKAPIRDESGNVTGLVGISRDITRRQNAEEKVRRLNRVHAVLSGINSLIVRVRERDELYREACRLAVEAGGMRMAWLGIYDRKAERVNPVASAGHLDGFLDLMSLSVADPTPEGRGIVRRTMREQRVVMLNDIEHDDQFRLREAALARGYRAAAAFPLVVGGETAGILQLFAGEPHIFDDEEMRLLTELAGDIAFAMDYIDKSERVAYLAYYDPLTGLANRSLFLEHLDQACRAAGDAGSRLAAAVVDIERFRTINDSLGRHAGDAILKEVAGRMLKHARDVTRFARIGPDQFAMLLPNAPGEDMLARMAEEGVRNVFGAPYQVPGQELRLGAKVGIAVFPGDGSDADTLFKNAEAALKKAKRNGERYLFYQQEMTDRVGEHLRLESRLRQAIERGELVLHYQPKIDLKSRRIVGVEALLRWQTPEGELVPPARFIPLMEETGLILEAGAWAMKRAVLDQRRLVELGADAPRIAVNVSAVQLRKRDFVETVKAALQDGVSPAALDLEITESLVMEHIESNIEKLAAVRQLGVNVAIDDFGTGYSSLAYLAKLPVNALKIDRSFVIRMLEDPNITTLVSTIISLAHSLKLTVVAEGVDAEAQANVLRLLRCDEMQGYLFSKPVPFDRLVQLLKTT